MYKIRFQWFFDISTSPMSMQVITISAGGRSVVDRLKPFFASYKYFKLGSIKATFVPASTLPVDPTGLSYQAGENTVDPRDQLNPGLTRITNGEDVFEDFTGVTLSQMFSIYNAMLLDNRWYKWQLQSGLKRYGTPRYWQIGQLHQDMYPGAVQNFPGFTGANAVVTNQTDYLHHLGGADMVILHGNSNSHGIFQTGHKGRIGWLPTDALYDGARRANAGGTPYESGVPAINAVPQVEVFKVILPPAYKTKFYYRVYVTEEVFFAGPITNFSNDVRSIDRFIVPTYPIPALPNASLVDSMPIPHPPNDGAGGD